MAQTPRGEPRTVPDPAGEKVDAMLRQERLKRQRREAAAIVPASFTAAPRLSPFDRRIEDLDLTPRSGSTVTIGGRTYKEVDNGRANVLIPVDTSLYTPAERAAQRAGVVRSLLMADSTVGAIA